MVALKAALEALDVHGCQSTSQKRRRRQNDATNQDLLKLNKMIRSAKPIECKLKIHQHADETLEGTRQCRRRRITTDPCDLTSSQNVTGQTVRLSILSWSSQNIKRVVGAQQWDEPDDDCRLQFGQLRGCPEEATRFVGDRLQKLCTTRSKGKEPLLHQRTNELAIVQSRAMEGEADLRWIDARYRIADCPTKHASRKSEEVLQQVINRAQWENCRRRNDAGNAASRERERDRQRQTDRLTEGGRERGRPGRFGQKANEYALVTYF